MIYFSKYAEQKFDTLNKYGIYYTREQIEDVINLFDYNGKKNNYLTAQKDGIKVIYKKEEGKIKIITFYPIKK